MYFISWNLSETFFFIWKQKAFDHWRWMYPITDENQTNGPLLQNLEWKIMKVEIGNQVTLLRSKNYFHFSNANLCRSENPKIRINRSIDKWQCVICSMQSKQHVPYGFDSNCFQAVFSVCRFCYCDCLLFHLCSLCSTYYLLRWKTCAHQTLPLP